MNLQFRLIDLLSEIDIICREEHLNYCLAEDTAWNAVNKGFLPDDVYEANVFMPAEDVEQFCKVAQVRFSNRRIESLYNNPNFPGFYIRYVDCHSLCFDLDKEKHFQTHGLHVNIVVLRHPIENKFKRKCFAVLERLWECKEEQRLGERNRYYRLGTFFWKCFGERAGSRFLYRNLLKYGKNGHNTSVFFHTSRGKRGNFDKKFWKNKELARLNGRWFFCLGAQYLPQKLPKYNKLKWSTIFDEDIPYENFIQELKQRELFNAGWIKGREKYARWYKTKAESTRKQVQQYWLYMFRTQARFSLWDRYVAKRELLMKAYEEEAFDDLKAILEPYMKEIRAYKRKNLGLCFDPLILKITLAVYCNEGKFRFAQKVLELIPIEHFESIGEYEQRKALGGSIDKLKLQQRKESLTKYLDMSCAQAEHKDEERERKQILVQLPNLNLKQDIILFECKSGKAFCGTIKQALEVLIEKYPERFQYVCVINDDLASEREINLEKQYAKKVAFVKKGSTGYKQMLATAKYIFVDDLLLPEYFDRKEDQIVIQIPYWEHISWNIDGIWKKSKKILKTFKESTHFLLDRTMQEYPVWNDFLSKIQESPIPHVTLIGRNLHGFLEGDSGEISGRIRNLDTNKNYFMLYECIDGEIDLVKKEINRIRCICEFVPGEVIFRVSIQSYETLKEEEEFKGLIVPRSLNAELLYDNVALVAASDSLPFLINARVWGKNVVLLNLRQKIKSEISLYCREHSITEIETAGEFYSFLKKEGYKKVEKKEIRSERKILEDMVDELVNEFSN